jgi:hypothetical protein
VRRQSRKKSAREVLRCAQDDYERTLATLRIEALPERGKFREIGIGGAVARSPLPHHPTCGSAAGGSEGYARPSKSCGSPREAK